MNNAKIVKNDEYYTLYSDISNELKHYKEELKNKDILCPCDYDFAKLTLEQQMNILNHDPKEIKDLCGFSRYFLTNPDKIEFKSVTYAHGDYETAINEFAKKHPNGVVITNPPFSLFRHFVKTLMDNKMKFLIIGGNTSLNNNYIFELWLQNLIGGGYNNPDKFFKRDDNKIAKVVGM